MTYFEISIRSDKRRKNPAHYEVLSGKTRSPTSEYITDGMPPDIAKSRQSDVIAKAYETKLGFSVLGITAADACARTRYR